MTEKPFQVVRLDELEPSEGVEGSRWFRLRRDLGLAAFGANVYGADAGKRVIEDHDELGGSAGRHEELYFVHSGRATFTVGDREIDAPAGTFVFVSDPATQRTAIAEEDGTNVLVVGGKAGEAYQVSIWDQAADAYPYFQSKEYAKGIEILGKLAAEHPGAAGVLYNLACFESLSGQPEAALEHLVRSIELDPKFRELAEADADFDPIRERPEFASAIAGKPETGGAPT